MLMIVVLVFFLCNLLPLIVNVLEVRERRMHERPCSTAGLNFICGCGKGEGSDKRSFFHARHCVFFRGFGKALFPARVARLGSPRLACQTFFPTQRR